MGVLCHEVHHLLFGHLLIDPADFADARALLIAEEVTANEWITLPLPGAPILLEHYPLLRRDEDTLTRYQRLAESEVPQFTHATDENSPSGVPESASAVPKNLLCVPKQAVPGQENAPHALDDHSLWDEARDSAVLSAMVIRVAVGEAASEISASEWNVVPDAFRSQVARVCAGAAPGNGIASIVPVATTARDWRKVLQRYVRHATELRPVFTRPPRRFPELVGVVPSSIRRPTTATIMVAIDTSGSISTTDLAEISSEIERFARDHRVTIVECDCTVRRTYPYSGRLRAVHGRGGTDFRPVFDRALLKSIKPDVIIYFTDGFGPAPAARPPVPTIWCLSEGGVKPASWGRELYMRELDSQHPVAR
jgi:predicted metal-dependent peptidase